MISTCHAQERNPISSNGENGSGTALSSEGLRPTQGVDVGWHCCSKQHESVAFFMPIFKGDRT